MSHSVEPSLGSYETISPTLKLRVETFITDKIRFHDLARTVKHAGDFTREDVPLARTVVLIPVAAHQEAGQIRQTLGEYAKQVTDEPFSVLLFLNCPTEFEESDGVQQTYDEYLLSVAQYPELDVRFSFQAYDEPKIGKIRSELWNSALILAHHEGLFDDEGKDVIGINHDIDTDYISPNYIRRIQEFYAERSSWSKAVNTHRPLPPRTTLVRHSYPEDLPNIAKVIFWSNLVEHQVSDRGGFEASLVIPFGWYVTGDGFSRDAATYETRDVLNGSSAPSIPQTIMTTSSRRYVERVGEHGLHNIWEDGSFTANDACRNNENFTDISFERAEEIIFEKLAELIEYCFIGAATNDNASFMKMLEILKISEDSPEDDAIEKIAQIYEVRIRRKLKLAEWALRGHIGSTLLADLVASSYEASEVARKFAEAKSSETREQMKLWKELTAQNPG
jgi:hypothetical protein